MNKRGNENRSVRNTKKRLREGLLLLMRDKPINKISVKELAELTDVNRGTFYFHYSDVHDMLKSLEDEFFRGFDEIIGAIVPGKSPAPGPAYPYLTGLFRFLGDNHDFCRIMLGPHGDIAFVGQLKQLVDEKCSYFWRQAAPSSDSRDFPVLNAFVINGCVGIIERWLSHDPPESPEEIARLAAKIIVASVRACLADPQPAAP